MFMYLLEEGCNRKKDCQFLHKDVGKDYYSSSVSISSPAREVCKKVSHYQKSEQSEKDKNKTAKISETSISDLESTYDFAQPELSDTDMNQE